MIKFKRFLAYILSAAMLIMIVPARTAKAADTSGYKFKYVIFSETAHRKSAGTTLGNLVGIVYFGSISSDEKTEEFTMKDSGNDDEARGDSLYTTKPPWTVTGIKITNKSNNAYCCHWLKLYVEIYTANGTKVGDRQIGGTYYPAGEDGEDHKTGVWIDQGEDHNASSIKCNLSCARNPSSIDGWDSFGKTEYIMPDYTGSDTIKAELPGTFTREWSYNKPFGGKDGSVSSIYNMFDWKEAGKLEFSVTGSDIYGSSVTKSALEKKGIFTEITTGKSDEYVSGFSINKKSLISYMNEKGINKLDIVSTLTFKKATFNIDGKSEFKKTFTIYRQAFGIADVRYSAGSGTGPFIREVSGNTTDNNYFNSETKSIRATVDVYYAKNDSALNGIWDIYSCFETKNPSLNNLYQKEIKFSSKPKLQIGADEDAKVIEASSDTAKINKYSDFTLDFPLDGDIDSENKGITLIIDGAYFESGNYKYYLTESQKDYTKDKDSLGDLSFYNSRYKIDNIVPEVKFSFNSSEKELNGWRQKAAIDYTVDEDLYVGSSQAIMNYRLKSSNTSAIYPMLKRGETTKKSVIVDSHAAYKNGNSSITVESAASGAEIDGMLEVVDTTDIAGNKVKTTLDGVKLDTLAPRAEISMKNVDNSSSDGSKSVECSFTVEEISKSAKIYYVFVPNNADGSNTMPEFVENNIEHESGEIESTIGKWAYFSQVADNNKEPDTVDGTAFLKVDKGDVFDGLIYWFATDGFGNKTKTSKKEIYINNENTDCDINILGEIGYPQKNYNIDVTSDGNKIYWRWQYPDGSGAIADYREYVSGEETGSGTQKDDQGNEVILDGKCTLEIKIKTNSGTESYYTKTVIFDNSAPEIEFTSNNPGTYRTSQMITVKAEDASDIQEATAKIVNTDGSAIDGEEEYELTVTEGMLNDKIAVGDLPSGAYAVTVKAIDNNGFETTKTSNPVYIRNAAPEISLNTESDKILGEGTDDEAPLFAENEYVMNVSVNESFVSASGKQILYWRASDSSFEYTSWVSAGEMTINENGFSLDFAINTPVKLTEGINNIYIQTVIAPDGIEPEYVSADVRTSDYVTMYYDTTAPEYRLSLSDEHTSEPITGTLALSDNLDGDITIDKNGLSDDTLTVEESETEQNIYTVTVYKNINSDIYAVDAAGNKTNIPIYITGIDNSAPTVTADASELDTVGDRTFAATKIYVNSADKGTVQFAVIPAANKAQALNSDGTIKDAYFVDVFEEENEEGTKETAGILPDDINAFITEVVSETAGDYEDESNLTYLVKLRGISGKYYIGVRAADSLGNTQNTLLGDVVLEPKDAEAKINKKTVTPSKAYGKALVNLTFNVPVYVLPQNMITSIAADDMTVEETNLENARKYAVLYSQSSSFTITETGTYALYVADELGRTQRIDLSVTSSDVTFENDTGITTQTVELVTSYDSSTDTFTDISRKIITGNNYAAPGDDGSTEYTVIEVIAPTGYTISPNTVMSADGEAVWDEEEGTQFWTEYSKQYISQSGGYTKLVYRTTRLYDYTGDDVNYIDKDERAIDVYLISPADGSKTPVTVYAGNIDNSPPHGTLTINPQTTRDEERNPLTFTPGNVIAEISFSDPQSGVKQFELYSHEVEDEEGYDVTVPFVDENGDPIDYSETPFTYDDDYISLTVYGDADIYGTKFVSVEVKQNTLAWPVIENNAGDFEMAGEGETGIWVDYINKTDISDADYTISYLYRDNTGEWLPITDGVYYKQAKAVIEITDSGKERGVYVSNNGKSNEKLLNSFDSEFTFALSDNYGYKRSVTAELSNFDETPGTIAYQLASTEKTNQPVDITITVSDDKSGVGSVTLKRGDEEIPLTDTGNGVFTGQVSNNGNHVITLIDKAGNTTQKVFIVSDIDSTLPEITNIEYSETHRTSKAVNAEISYSKPNVTITKTESASGISEDDYTVDYKNSVIRFRENGSISIWFTDDYGNVGMDVITVTNIYKTPPALEAVMTIADNKSSVDVSFKKATNDSGAEIDSKRELSEIMVDYNGIVKLAEENGEKAVYTFDENGVYTFKVYDDEGVSSYLTIEITDIDKAAPKITQIRWSYDYDVLENGEWVTKKSEVTREVGSESGYRIATDVYPITNENVDVTVVTDSETTILGNDDYGKSTEHTLTYQENGMYIFNMQKENGLTDSYGFDVNVIDKTPPIIDLASSEMVFYENPASNSVAYSKDLITKAGTAFKAYDVFGGEKDLSDRVTIDFGDFNADDISKNTFDRTKPYTITYKVSDDANNTAEAQMTIRLVGFYDTVALVNGEFPDYSGRKEINGDTINISLKNFSGISYARIEKGVRTLGEMKTEGEVLKETAFGSGEYTYKPTEEGWYTILVQTDKRDYFNLQVYIWQ